MKVKKPKLSQNQWLVIIGAGIFLTFFIPYSYEETQILCLVPPCPNPHVTVKLGGAFWLAEQFEQPKINTFEECVAAGNPVQESFPRQCVANGEHFIEEVFQIPDCSKGPC